MNLRFAAVRTIVPTLVAVVTPLVVVTATPVRAADVATQTCSEPTPGAAVPGGLLDHFEPVTPTRIVDTRDGLGGVDAPIGAGCTLRVDLGATDVPADAEAAALSVTAIAPQRGFLTVFPCSTGRPSTSNLNARGNAVPTPNLVVATPDDDRAICIFSQFESDVIVDVTGWWLPGGDTRLTTVAPVRAEDSREGGAARVPARTERVIDLSGIVPAGTTAVVGNLTVTEPALDGFMTAYPCGTDLPLASNLNFVASESRAVAVAVGVDAQANLCVQSNVDAHVVFDVAGYYEPAPSFGPVAGLQPLSGARLADSREGTGEWSGKLGAGEVRRLTPTAGRPNHSQTVGAVLNVVATEADRDGFLTIYPCDEPRPTASVLNYTPDGESTNLVPVDLARDGDVCVYALTATHVVVDLFGVVAAEDGLLVEELALDADPWPAYTPDGVDYIAHCGARTDIDIELLRGATARVNGVPVVSGRIDVPTSPDDRIRLELRRGGTVHSHSFRCVPDDFPRLDIERSGEPGPGWYVTTIRRFGTGAGYTAILDHRGVPVWYKRVDGDVIDVQRRADGRIVLVQSLGPRYGVDPDAGYLAMSLFGTVTDVLTAAPMPDGSLDPDAPDDPDPSALPVPVDHHEYIALPGGGHALIVYTPYPADLSELGPGYEEDDEISENIIQEVADDGSLIWAWQTGDHFGVDVTFPQRWGPIEGYPGNEVDVYHLNSIDRVLEPGCEPECDYVASARHMDNVFRVDRSTGAVEWVLGPVPPDSPDATKNAQLTIVGDPLGGPRRMHDARLVGDVLTMFDNRTATTSPARAVAYRIDEDAKTATFLWSIDDPEGRTSAALGSARVLGDGNVVISWGAGIEPSLGEYTADGEPVIEITQIGGGNSYRFLKYPVGMFDAAVLRATAGGEVDLS